MSVQSQMSTLKSLVPCPGCLPHLDQYKCRWYSWQSFHISVYHIQSLQLKKRLWFFTCPIFSRTHMNSCVNSVLIFRMHCKTFELKGSIIRHLLKEIWVNEFRIPLTNGRILVVVLHRSHVLHFGQIERGIYLCIPKSVDFHITYN